MKKFTLYAWRTDNEGGEGVCLSEKWSPNVGYNPESGPRARPSIKLLEFDTYEELLEYYKSEGDATYALEDTDAMWDAAEKALTLSGKNEGASDRCLAEVLSDLYEEQSFLNSKGRELENKLAEVTAHILSIEDQLNRRKNGLRKEGK